MMHATDGYLTLLREMHARAPWGTKGSQYLDEFMPWFNELKCTSLLDYGCGRRSVSRAIAERRLPIAVHDYDPAIDGLDAKPEPADFVVCTDVLEHVEDAFVPAVLDDLCRLTKVGAFVVVSLVEAKRSLPDGRNAHITIKPSREWIELLSARNWSTRRYEIGKKMLKVWLRSR